MAISINELRVVAVLKSRHFKELFKGDNGDLKRSGERVLADLRTFCGWDRPSIFDTDPLIMARREGRREVFARIIRFLNLDEAVVQKLMELDDE